MLAGMQRAKQHFVAGGKWCNVIQRNGCVLQRQLEKKCERNYKEWVSMEFCKTVQERSYEAG